MTNIYMWESRDRSGIKSNMQQLLTQLWNRLVKHTGWTLAISLKGTAYISHKVCLPLIGNTLRGLSTHDLAVCHHKTLRGLTRHGMSAIIRP